MFQDVFPTKPEDLTPKLLTAVIDELHPGTTVQDVRVIESKVYGDGMVSTAGRIVLDLDYGGAGRNDLPPRVVIKVPRGDTSPRPLYENEVAFYLKIRPDLDIEAPAVLGGTFDEKTGAFGLILEDLRLRDARFPNVTVPVTLDEVKSLLDMLARLHARYWNSPALTGTLSWVQTHLSGALHTLFNEPTMVPAIIEAEIASEQFKREMLERLGQTGASLLAQVQALQKHQAKLPTTLLHGDTHIGNTYLLPGQRGGLLDWQLMVRGYCLHDVTYLLVTSQTVAMRRTHERALLSYYLDRLAAYGVSDAPSLETAWLEYRRAAAWGVYIGWLTTPTTNYGWEICVMNHLRLMTAYEDLETAKALQDIL